MRVDFIVENSHTEANECMDGKLYGGAIELYTYILSLGILAPSIYPMKYMYSNPFSCVEIVCSVLYALYGVCCC